MKRAVTTALLLFFLVPTCESVWAFSSHAHATPPPTASIESTDAMTSKAVVATYGNLEITDGTTNVFVCKNHAAHSPSPCSETESCSIDAALRGTETLQSFLKQNPPGNFSVFSLPRLPTRKSVDFGFSKIRNFQGQEYFNLVGIVKRLD